MDYTDEEKQYLIDATAFSACTDVCWDDANNAENVRISLSILRKMAAAGLKTSDCLHVYGSELLEDPEIANEMVDELKIIKRKVYNEN